MIMKRIMYFIHKCGFMWIGWILKQDCNPEVFYYDNRPVTNTWYEENVEYLTIGFTKNQVTNKIIRYVKQNASKEATV